MWHANILAIEEMVLTSNSISRWQSIWYAHLPESLFCMCEYNNLLLYDGRCKRKLYDIIDV